MNLKKGISLLLGSALLVGMLAGCNSQPQSSENPSGNPAPAGAYTAGTYTGTADGNNGPVTVEVTVSDSAITSVVVTEESETESSAAPALERIP